MKDRANRTPASPQNPCPLAAHLAASFSGGLRPMLWLDDIRSKVNPLSRSLLNHGAGALV